MYIADIRLAHFRSYRAAQFDFADTVTAIIGKNGSGKTNLLEALYVLATGKSFRDSDQELSHHSVDWWQLVSTIDDAKHRAEYRQNKKSFERDGKKFQRVTHKTRLPVVLFEPDDLLLIHGSPSRRRRFIDDLLSELDPQYSVWLHRYEKTLRQRNALLKSQPDSDLLFVWDVMLAEQAAKIVMLRTQLVAEFNETLSHYYSHIADIPTRIAVHYESSMTLSEHYSQQFIRALQANLERDRHLGYTSVGPHRDDLEFYINDKPFVSTASRGEVRSLLLALKKYELDRKQTIAGTAPLLLLDDVFSELDHVRQQKLARGFYDGQTIITSVTTPRNISYRIDLTDFQLH